MKNSTTFKQFKDLDSYQIIKSGSELNINYYSASINPIINSASININGDLTVYNSLENGVNNYAVTQAGHAEGENTVAGYVLGLIDDFTDGGGNIVVQGDQTPYYQVDTPIIILNDTFNYVGTYNITSITAGVSSTNIEIASYLNGYVGYLISTTYGYASHAEGGNTFAIGPYSHAEGYDTRARGSYSHAEGNSAQAVGNYSHAEGQTTTASGSYSHAEGTSTTAEGLYSHAEGQSTQAIGVGSHAEGAETQAIGYWSHAEGNSTIAIGPYSHAEGGATQAVGGTSHAEGLSTQAIGDYSHAEGNSTQAIGNYSHAEGLGTVASGLYQHVQGQYNISSSATSAFIIGNGASNISRSNLVFASGSTFQVTGSVIATQGFTGSLFGTASQAISSSRAISASFASTASFAPAYLPLTGGTVSGSLIIQNNLTVLGSASIQYISESTLNIGTNLITVNTFTPSVRFGGLAVIDSGSSPVVSASFLYDSLQDEFIFVHKGTAAGAITSSHFVLGPETYNNLGNETYLTANRIPKGVGNEHLNDSNISDNGSVVSINSNSEITGSLRVTQGITGSLFGTSSVSSNIVVTEDASTNATYYPILSPSSSGIIGARVDSNQLQYNPSTNTLTAGDLTLVSGGPRTLTIQATGAGGTEIKLLPNSTGGHARINVGNTTQPLDFQMNSNDVMRIAQDGKVGIGTTGATAKLEVRGTGINSSTTAFLIKNASLSDLLKIGDGGGMAHGNGVTADGSYSHAEGLSTIASGQYSHTEGFGTVASGSYQHVQGQYNISSSAQSAFIIGNGTADNARSNLVFASGSTFQVTGSVIATQGFTGSLFGTASFAATASFALNAGGGGTGGTDLGLVQAMTLGLQNIF